jgi:cobyric acid synthase
MMLENQKIKGFELEIENLQKQNKANNTIITRQKSEIERLKKKFSI